jgi:hypothetical protein
MVLPRLSCSAGPNCRGRHLPSSNSMEYIIPLRAQQTEWYSFNISQSFLGTNIKPGHVQGDIHLDIYSSRHDTHDGENVSIMLLFRALLMRSQT